MVAFGMRPVAGLPKGAAPRFRVKRGAAFGIATSSVGGTALRGECAAECSAPTGRWARSCPTDEWAACRWRRRARSGAPPSLRRACRARGRHRRPPGQADGLAPGPPARISPPLGRDADGQHRLCPTMDDVPARLPARRVPTVPALPNRLAGERQHQRDMISAAIVGKRSRRGPPHASGPRPARGRSETRASPSSWRRPVPGGRSRRSGPRRGPVRPDTEAATGHAGGRPRGHRRAFDREHDAPGPWRSPQARRRGRRTPARRTPPQARRPSGSVARRAAHAHAKARDLAGGPSVHLRPEADVGGERTTAGSAEHRGRGIHFSTRLDGQARARRTRQRGRRLHPANRILPVRPGAPCGGPESSDA